MALNAYLKLKGQKQGEIKGSVIQKGRENKIQVIAVSQEMQRVDFRAENACINLLSLQKN